MSGLLCGPWVMLSLPCDARRIDGLPEMHLGAAKPPSRRFEDVWREVLHEGAPRPATYPDPR
jgi:hypothetical protein